MKHRVIAALLALAALLSFLPAAQAAEPELIYTLRDGEAIITGASGDLTGQLLIPEELNGHQVVGIAERAFDNQTGLISVVIQAKVEQLGPVFRSCTALTEAVLPEGLTTLNGTFSGCTALAEITLPSTVKYLGSRTFQNTALRELRLPDGLKEIGADCFSNVPLQEIALPAGLERVGAGAFRGFAELRSLVIPSSVRYLDAAAFSGSIGTVFVRGRTTDGGKLPFASAQRVYCHSGAPVRKQLADYYPTIFYEELPYDPEAQPVAEENGLQYAVIDGEAVVISGAGGEELTVPAKLGGAPVTMVAPLCFSGAAERYASVTLPDSVRWVGRGAIDAERANVPQALQYAGERAFANVTLTGEPQFFSLVTAETESFFGCGLTAAVFGPALRTLGRRAFALNDLRTVTLAEGVETLGAEVFAWNAALTALTVPSTVTQCDDCLKNSKVARVVGDPDGAMAAYCEREGILFIDARTGEEVGEARLVTLDHIQYKIFPSGRAWVVDCEPEQLTGEVVIPASVDGAVVERICDSALAHCGATIIRLPETVRVLEDWAFLQCRSLAYVAIPERLETVLGTPFAACEKLRLLYLPPSYRQDSLVATHLYGLEVLVGYEDTEAERLAQSEGLRFIALPKDAAAIKNETGVFVRQDDALTAVYLRLEQSGGRISAVVPDEVDGLPVTRIAAGAVGDPDYAVLGANVQYVEDGAFYTGGEPAHLAQLVVPASVQYLPPRVSDNAGLTIFGSTGSYADRYAAENGYRFLDRATTPFRDVARSAWYHDAIRTVYWNGLMNGVGENRFAPNETTTRAMVAQVLANLSGIRDFTWSYGFRDVPEDAWYAGAVNWGAMVGIIQGTSKTTFSPEDPVTREQLATLLYRFARACGVDVTARAELDGFGDRGQISQYALSAMQWAVASGVIRGTGPRTLQPRSYATRAEIAQMLCNFMRLTGRTKSAKAVLQIA